MQEYLDATLVFEDDKLIDVNIKPKKSDIVFTVDEYSTRTEMYNDIGVFISLLMKYGYVCFIRDDDSNIIVVEYELNNDKFNYGADSLCWLTENEADFIDCMRGEIEDRVIHDARHNETVNEPRSIEEYESEI